MEITRHFTATTMIVHESEVLLHWHKKLDRWLPVGGHIERDEIPHEAALREVQEEAGVEIELFNPGQSNYGASHQSKDVQELPLPATMFLEDINPFHQHIDLIFFAKALSKEIGEDASERDSLRWVALSEMEELSVPDDVQVLAKRALSSLAG